jgi:hypothetical protein
VSSFGEYELFEKYLYGLHFRNKKAYPGSSLPGYALYEEKFFMQILS